MCSKTIKRGLVGLRNATMRFGNCADRQACQLLTSHPWWCNILSSSALVPTAGPAGRTNNR